MIRFKITQSLTVIGVGGDGVGGVGVDSRSIEGARLINGALQEVGVEVGVLVGFD